MKVVTVCLPYKLSCARNSAVVICLDSSLTASGAPFIDGFLVCVETRNTICGSTEYCHFLSYDKYSLADPNTALCPEDITGAFCDDCIREWITTKVTEAQGEWWPEATMFGDGSDGNLTVVGDELLPTTLTTPVRNYFFDNVTVNAQAILRAWGSYNVNPEDALQTIVQPVRIYVADTLTISGTITADGSYGASCDGTPDFYFDAGPGGGYIATPPSGAFPDDPGDGMGGPFYYVAGGLGGAGGDTVGGGSGYVPTAATDGSPIKYSNLIFSPKSIDTGQEQEIIAGGAGGGGGGGHSVGSEDGGMGGCGGNGGGLIFIAARRIVIAQGGVISARGSNGADGGDAVNNGGGGAATGGGGGGGGGGGCVYLIYEELVEDGTIDVSAGAGGAGGAGVNGGASGSAGVTGIDGAIYRMYLPTGVFE